MQPSHNLGRYEGSSPYHRKRASHHSCATSFLPFTVDRCTIIHIPVFITHYKWRATRAGASSRVSSSTASNLKKFLRQPTPPPFHPHSRRISVWYAVLKFSWTLSAATRCPLMIQDDVHFSGAILVGSGREILYCFTGKWVTPRAGTPSPTPWKRANRK